MDFGSPVNGFSGPNGIGKTNILDAIHYLCLAKSHFINSDAEIVMHGETFFRLTGLFEDVAGNPLKVVIKVEPGKRKEITLNGKKFNTLGDYIGRIPVLFQAPDDIYHLLEQSAERRKWVDRALAQQDQQYLADLVKYNKLLKQRNAWLKSSSDNRTPDWGILDWYDGQMAPLAGSIAARRSDFISGINRFFQQYYEQISNGNELVSLGYEGMPDNSYWLEKWRSERSLDLSAQRTLSGIHRDDLDFGMNEKPLKRVGSQGQIKSFILALVLSHYKLTKEITTKIPILLLDDIFARLDQTRVTALLRFLSEEGMGSVFVTDTDHDRLEQIMQKTKHEFTIFNMIGNTVRNHEER